MCENQQKQESRKRSSAAGATLMKSKSSEAMFMKSSPELSFLRLCSPA